MTERICVISGCGKATHSRLHLCHMHYERLRLRGSTYAYVEPTCSHCEKPVAAHGLCNAHYMKLRRTGTFKRLRRQAVAGGRTRREHHLLSRYGLSLEKYNELEGLQEQRCAICREQQPAGKLFVDHDHETGEVRALLCPPCNTLLGFVEKREDPEAVMSGVMAYCDAFCI